MHGVLLLPQHLHLGHAGNSRNALRDARLGVLIQGPQGKVSEVSARYKMG